MTKGAVASMTRGLARDLGPRGITVNAIAPGPTETDMTADPDMQAIVRPQMSIGRLGTAREVASLAAYLAGPDAGFVTGASLTIDGGYWRLIRDWCRVRGSARQTRSRPHSRRPPPGAS
jgi:3-oxoacyl-[acyl-carrier protein] reductase